MNIQRAILTGAIALTLTGCESSGTTEAGNAPAAAPAGSPSVGTVPPTLRSTIASTLKIDESKVTPSATFTADLGADELALVELVMAYERVFKVDIRNPDADRFKNVQDVMSFLQKHDALR